MLSVEQITKEKTVTKYAFSDHHHEHDDCIRIAYEWLDAQKKIKNPTTKTFTLKHIIEKWAGRYVSQSDVEVAAQIHPLIKGSYPRYNISSRLTNPSQKRLENIAESHTQDYKETYEGRYSFQE